MDGTTVVLGFGAVGRAVTAALATRGGSVRVAQRRRPAVLPAGVNFAACDVLDAPALSAAVAGAAQVVIAIGLPYDARVWRATWPQLMNNVLDACAASGARVVFADNLYQLGPQTEPRREDMPLTDRGHKPAILAQVTRLWQGATGRVRFAALRLSDFYGPGVNVSHLGDPGFGRIAENRTAWLLIPPDTPHDFAYMPDVARAVLSLLDAPDDCYGQVWNLPCAPTRTAREILTLGAASVGMKARIRAVPFALLPALGLVSRFPREIADVGFTFDRPYQVDGRKFARRFGFEPTPYEEGAPATLNWFRSSNAAA